MDFRSINKFNVIVNAISGNFFPLSEDQKSFNLGSMIYMIFIWVVELATFISVVTAGLNYVPGMQVFQEGAVTSMNTLEMIIISVYLHSRRKRLQNLIGKINNILVDSDDLRRCLSEIVEPQKRSFTAYTIMSTVSTIIWAIMPLHKILQNDTFTYDDYTVPAYLPGEPFNVTIFTCGVLMQVTWGVSLALKKISVDVYVGHFVSLLTAEYKYVRHQMAATLQRKNENKNDDKLVIAALHKCIQHHCAVMETGRMLVEIMAVHVGITYIDSILKFCFLGFSFIKFGDNYYLKSIYFAYGFGVLIQVYLLCSGVQDLLEASTSVTDDAFYEDWHGCSSTVKKLFWTIELSNQMECRLTAFRIIDLTTPTLALILNQAYSACLLLLRV